MGKLAGYGLIGAIVALGMLGLGYWAGTSSTEMPATAAAHGDDASGGQIAGLDEAIRGYLLANPEVLIEVQESLQAKQEEAQRVAQLSAITDESAAIFQSASDAVIANPDGAVTMVEFFDYNCGYCKRALDDMNAMIGEDKDLRFVLKGFPILGPDSHAAHVVSEAFKMMLPEKYLDFHRQLLGGGGRADEARAIKIAVSLGADEAELRQKMTDPQIEQNFRETYKLADALGITGTPSYVVADEVVFGAVGTDALISKIENARSCGSTVC